MLLLVCFVCVLAGCGSANKVRDETEISADVQAQDAIITDCALRVDSFSVTKRQTNPENKNDFVWCTIKASNKDFSYSADYELTYVLYNDGWQLEGCYKGETSITPARYPTQEEATEIVRERFSDNELKKYNAKTSEAGTTIVYPFLIIGGPNIKNGVYYGDYIDMDYTVWFTFDIRSGWSSELRAGSGR